MNKLSRTIALITYLLFFVFAILSLVSSIQGLSALNAISGESNKILSSLRGMFITSLLAVIGIVIALATGTTYSVKNYSGHVATLGSVFAIYLLSDLISGFIGLSILDGTTIPATVVITIIVEIIALISAFVSIGFSSSSERNNEGIVSGIITALLLLIAVIITMSSTTISSTLTVMGYVFLILSILGSGLFYLVKYNENIEALRARVLKKMHEKDATEKNQKANDYPISDETSVVREEPKVQPSSDDPVAQLEKLKNLLDKGVITKEEYEEKRKKYVDML